MKCFWFVVVISAMMVHALFSSETSLCWYPRHHAFLKKRPQNHYIPTNISGCIICCGFAASRMPSFPLARAFAIVPAQTLARPLLITIFSEMALEEYVSPHSDLIGRDHTPHLPALSYPVSFPSDCIVACSSGDSVNGLRVLPLNNDPEPSVSSQFLATIFYTKLAFTVWTTHFQRIR